MYNFKKFIGTGGSFAPKFTIRRGGSLGISQGAAKRFGIDGDKYYAVFFYDTDQRVIGMKITEDGSEEGAVKIQWRPYKGSDSNIIIQASIKALLDSYGIDYSESKSYVPVKDEQSGLIIVDLKKPKIKKGGPPGQKEQAATGDL